MFFQNVYLLYIFPFSGWNFIALPLFEILWRCMVNMEK